MNTKLLGSKALSVIDQYKNFRIGHTECSIPYYNNRHMRVRASFKAENGKGSPKDIFDEVSNLLAKEKIDQKTLSSIELKKFLVDNNIGIDCSGLAYYILSNEYGSIDKHLAYPFCKGLIGKIRCKFRPVENTDVATFAHEKNSRVVEIKNANPGDIITMVGSEDSKERDHILVIDQIEYQNFVPTKLHYINSTAWPTDGEYGHGVRDGSIEITDITKPLVEQRWIEAEKTGDENYNFARAKKSHTELRRLKWL